MAEPNEQYSRIAMDAERDLNKWETRTRVGREGDSSMSDAGHEASVR
jgi:hypothetical protein